MRRHRPPPGLASGEPDDRLQRTIQYSATLMIIFDTLEYWMPACAGMTT
jgi:hypothetical protein